MRGSPFVVGWPTIPLANDGEDFFLAHDEVVGAVDLDLGAGVLAHQDLVSSLHLERDALALVREATRPHGDDLRLLRLLLRGVGDDDPTALGLGLLEAADKDAIGERLHVHGLGLLCCNEWRDNWAKELAIAHD